MKELNINSTWVNWKVKLIEKMHPNYQKVGICCNMKDFDNCYKMSYRGIFGYEFVIWKNPNSSNQKYSLPMYLIMKRKQGYPQVKLVKYHTYHEQNPSILYSIAAKNHLKDVRVLRKELSL